MNPRVWTEQDEAELMKLHGTMRAAKIAERLGRTVNAVYRRAADLGINNPQKNRSDRMKKPPMERVTPWVEHLVDILDKAIELHEQGIEVECKSKSSKPRTGGVELIAYFAEVD